MVVQLYFLKSWLNIEKKNQSEIVRMSGDHGSSFAGHCTDEDEEMVFQVTQCWDQLGKHCRVTGKIELYQILKIINKSKFAHKNKQIV